MFAGSGAFLEKVNEVIVELHHIQAGAGCKHPHMLLDLSEHISVVLGKCFYPFHLLFIFALFLYYFGDIQIIVKKFTHGSYPPLIVLILKR